MILSIDIKDFFKLFSDFKGYCEFFLLNDLVKNNFGEINFFIPFCEFNTSPLPQNKTEYFDFMNNNISFVTKRNNRISLLKS